jgi:hypothetical protein
MPRVHLTSDNEPLSPGEYEAIRRGLADIERVHAGYRPFVATHDLDPAVFLPGGIWGELYGFDTLERFTYDRVNLLRCFATYFFTGFDYLLWDRRDSPRADTARADRFRAEMAVRERLPRELDALLEHMFQLTSRLELSGYLADEHERLTRNVPARYVARCPGRMGELGIVHESALVNPDLLTYQSRLNAMVGGGVTAVLERAAARDGTGTVMEIGPGYCFLPWVLDAAFDGRLQFFLVDLPKVMAYGYAYLAGIAGTERVAVITEPGQALPATPFVFLPNYLLPSYASQLPRFDVICNALSLNEMIEPQVDYYLEMIDQLLNPDGVFFLEQGGKYLDYHYDAQGAACRKFPRHRVCSDLTIAGMELMAAPNSYFYANCR